LEASEFFKLLQQWGNYYLYMKRLSTLSFLSLQALQMRYLALDYLDFSLFSREDECLSQY